jgi:membrane protease YdiL (CAAX protease family)
MFYENFVNETEARSSIKTAFLSITFVVVGMLLAALLLWSYQKADALFYALFLGLILLYIVISVTFVAIIRKKLTAIQFEIFMAASIFIAIFIISIMIFFIVKAVKILKRSGSESGSASASNSSSQKPYVSKTLVDYTMDRDDRMNYN